jgi:hypothetical protein
MINCFMLGGSQFESLLKLQFVRFIDTKKWQDVAVQPPLSV